MKSIVIFVATFGFCLGLPHERIVGGQNAVDGRHPFMASVRYVMPDSHACGGSIITKRTILTDAHCLQETTPDNVLVVVGTNKWNEGGVVYKAEALKPHKDFDEDTIRNNIGLVIVEKDIAFTPKVQQIELDTNPLAGDVDIYMIGWGRMEEEGPLSDALKYLEAKTITNAQCITRLGNFGRLVFDSSVCVLHKSGEGACTSDSGGPIVAGNKLVGLISWGIGCGTAYPTVNSRISSYDTWINANKV